MMRIALSTDADNNIYGYNPCSGSQFAIYEVFGTRHDIHYRFVQNCINPWERCQGVMVKDPDMKSCTCDKTRLQDPQHIHDHYAILEAIGKCDYLIAKSYCINTFYALQNVGIKIHKIPPFLMSAEDAITHFLIATDIAKDMQSIQHTL